MTIEEIRDICMVFPGVTEDIKWETHLCFNIGEKMFVITNPDQVPPSVPFKTSPEDFEILSAKKGFKPAQYLARYNWIYVDDIERLNKKQWQVYLKKAYDLIAGKLSKNKKKQLGIL